MVLYSSLGSPKGGLRSPFGTKKVIFLKENNNFSSNLSFRLHKTIVSASSTALWRLVSALPTSSPTQIHLHRFTYTDSPTQIHLHRITYTDSPTQIHLHRFTYTESPTQIHLHRLTSTDSPARIHRTDSPPGGAWLEANELKDRVCHCILLGRWNAHSHFILARFPTPMLGRWNAHPHFFSQNSDPYAGSLECPSLF